MMLCPKCNSQMTLYDIECNPAESYWLCDNEQCSYIIFEMEAKPMTHYDEDGNPIAKEPRIWCMETPEQKRLRELEKRIKDIEIKVFGKEQKQ